MAVLSNSKHELFAQGVARGEDAVSAYGAVFNCAEKSARANAFRLRKNAEVCARVRELQSVAAERVVWSVEERLRYFKEVAETPAGEVDANHRLCQSMKTTGSSQEVRTPDKLRAVIAFGELAGDYAKKAEASDLDKIVDRLFGQVKPEGGLP